MAQTTRDIAMHVCNRIAFGPTPALMQQLTTPAAISAYITSQLNPTTNDNAETTALLAQCGLPTAQATAANIAGLQGAGEVRAAFSDWQLREVMTRFWNDHFNRSFGVIRFFPAFGGIQIPPPNGDDYATWFIAQDDAFFRANALGTFANLLNYTAGSVSMQIYLDNWQNKAGALNENWARELLELFTMGERNQSTGTTNYGQQDVVGVARCFTGWTVQNNGATPPLFGPGFDPLAMHDSSAKALFPGTAHPLTVRAGGDARFDGSRVLTHLAGTTATKDFMVRKLMVLFLGEAAPTAYPTLLTTARNAWGSQGDIKAVLTVLLNSTQFLTAAQRWTKVKSPLRHDIGQIRAFGARANVGYGPYIEHMFTTWFAVGAMGQPLYSYPSPDGYPMTNAKQIGISGYTDRIDIGERIYWEPSDPFAGFYGPIGNPIVSVGPFDVGFAPEQLIYTQMPAPQWLNSTLVAGFLLTTCFGDKSIAPTDVAAVAAKIGTAAPQTLPYAIAVREACELIATFTHYSLH